MATQSPASPIASALLLGRSLLLALTLWGTAAGRAEPAGTNMGAVQFDGVIELNRYSARSLLHDYTVMFARYWVARDYYSAAVVWAEPQSTDLFFAIRPPSLSVASSGQEFKVCHESIKKSNEPYKKPLGERGVFRYKFGSYPIGNVRFGEQEALATRIYTADLKDWKEVSQTGGKELEVSIPASEANGTRDVAKLRVQASAGHIDSMELFDARQQLLKSISYEYASKGGKAYLRRQIVTLPERPITVGFKGEGMKVTLDAKEYRYRELEAMHHAGGRRCIADYEPVGLGNKEVILPVRVTVRGGKDDQILRCVHLTNFKKVELDAVGVAEAARQFGAVSADQREYEKLRRKYWKKAPEAIKKDDVEAIGQLRGRFEKTLAAPDESPGEKLRHLNILMDLDVILGDKSGIEHHYKRYLTTLAENKLLWMTLVGGYGVIETAMFRERRSEAAMLLDRWVDTVLEINDAQSILLFAKRQLAKKRLWTTAVLLEKFVAKQHLDADVRFEADVLRCTAIDELCRLMFNPEAIKGLTAEMEADWVRSWTGPGGLEKMLADSLGQGGRAFEDLSAPTESQQVLKAQLGKIGKEMNQGKSQ